MGENQLSLVINKQTFAYLCKWQRYKKATSHILFLILVLSILTCYIFFGQYSVT